MIHELIDPKKRIAVRSNGTKNGKIPSDVIAKSNDATHPRLESYSENESREHGSTSNTFIPPWLRSSLGFNQRNSQSHALSDQKSSKSVPRYKDHVNCGPEETKVDDQSECTIRVTCDLSNTINQDCLEDVNMSANADVTSVNCHHERSNTVYWSNARKGSEGESLCTNPEIKILQRDPKLSHGNAKEDDKRQSKMSKQRTRGRRRIYNEYNFDGEKKEVDLMVEVKAKEILDNYSKQEAHSTSSDMKQLEAKLILLGAKCRQVDSAKWNQHEMKLLQEIKEQTGNKEEFDKFMTHVIETNLSDRLKISERSLKLKRERSKKEDKKIGCMEKEKLDKEVVAESRLTVSDRDSVKSTDEENDIKRFSEFLSKNKNIDEKRKCLEEVRNYFERKRRTRLTKRRCSDEDKKGKNDEIVRQLATEKDDHPRERPSTGKNWTSLSGGKEKKSKFVPCNEGVVEKAVSETLQKFMSYYHFHVSPTMMGNMRRNILEAIQSDSLDSTPSKMNLTKGNSVSLENTKDGRIPYRAKESCDEAREIKCVTNDGLKCSSGSYETTDESNKACCTPTATSNHFQPEGRTGKDVPPVENDNFEILKNEFDNCLKSVQCHADGSGLKLQSLIMEREETSTVKGIRFLYNFTKKSLEFAQLDSDEKKSCTGDMVKSKNFKESETQTSFQSEVMMKSTRIQTIDMTNKEENSVQTDDKTYVDNSVQTDSNQSSNIKEVRELKDVNVIPGLYRMVKSRHIGRFYLYPEESKTHILPKTTATTLTSNMTDSSFAFKCNHCNVKTKTDMLNMHNHEENTKSSKELKVLYRDKSSGVGGRRSRVQCYRTQRLPPESNLESSISCLYFGNSGNSGKSCDEGNPLDKCDISSGEAEHEEEHNMRATDDHFGCFWFWNGEKITPGSDLKIHVEDLLKEKLKEINTQHKEILMKFIEVGRKGEKNRISQEDDTTNKQPPIKKSSNQMLEVKNANAVYCFKNDNPGEASSLLKRIRLARGIQCRGVE
ncbi:hypothetical protein RUM43_000073 [Polyplax serrata]|uniref:Uncharacterized protein n=1 Tax=Polyplax serrata TaxID=468196 RepID=A0AAN8XNE8_POLSC